MYLDKSEWAVQAESTYDNEVEYRMSIETKVPGLTIEIAHVEQHERWYATTNVRFIMRGRVIGETTLGNDSKHDDPTSRPGWTLANALRTAMYGAAIPIAIERPTSEQVEANAS